MLKLYGIRPYGTRRGTALLVSVRITAPAMELARLTTIASASRDLMERMSGQDLIAPSVLALVTLLGSVRWSMPTMFTLGWSAPTRAPAIARLAPALASLVMMALLASVPRALTIVMTEEPAGLRSIWPARVVERTTNPGMP